jgi:hypothetical protein
VASAVVPHQVWLGLEAAKLPRVAKTPLPHAASAAVAAPGFVRCEALVWYCVQDDGTQDPAWPVVQLGGSCHGRHLQQKPARAGMHAMCSTRGVLSVVVHAHDSRQRSVRSCASLW